MRCCHLGGYCRFKEICYGAGNDPDLEVPIWFNWPALAFFWSKLASVIFAYFLLLDFAFEAITFE